MIWQKRRQSFQKIFLSLILLSLCSHSSHALQISENHFALNQKLLKMVQDSGVSEQDLGLWVSVQGAQGVENILDIQSQKKMIPASLSKLITLGASLHLLGPNFMFQTLLSSDAEIKSRALKGNLYLVGGGDPAFVSENMWALVNELSRSKVQVVEGDIIVDDSRLDRNRIDENRDPKRSDEAYDAPVGAMSFNWNSANIFIRPTPQLGGACEVFLDPVNAYLRLENQCRIIAGGENQIAVARTPESLGDLIHLDGQLGVTSSEVVFFRNITQPDLWSGQNLIEFLKQRGIQVKGQVRSGRAPAHAKILASHQSRALALIAHDMAKVSNNFVAEMLTKNIAAESGESPATMKTGLALIRKFMSDLGLDTSQMTFLSPSGLTRANQMSAFFLSSYLHLMQNDFSIFPEFLTSLPVAGRDGTLQDRNKDMKHIGWIRAKTGTLDGVVGLAGYIGMTGGRVATFTFMFNGPLELDSNARKLFDDLAAEVTLE